VLVRVVRSGSGAPCACFGSVSVAPVGWSAVVRNVGLCVLALGAMGSARGVPEVRAVAVVGMALAAGAIALRGSGRRLGARWSRPAKLLGERLDRRRGTGAVGGGGPLVYRLGRAKPLGHAGRPALQGDGQLADPTVGELGDARQRPRPRLVVDDLAEP